jgi:hypothetical protein
MSRDKKASVEPVRKSVSVSWAPDKAYRRFTQDFAKWWPSYSYSIASHRVGLSLGWGLVLDRFAGRLRPVLLFFYAMSLGITLIGQRGKFVRTSLGKMED